jgi:hypothetical protein
MVRGRFLPPPPVPPQGVCKPPVPPHPQAAGKDQKGKKLPNSGRPRMALAAMVAHVDKK